MNNKVQTDLVLGHTFCTDDNYIARVAIKVPIPFLYDNYYKKVLLFLEK